MLMAVTTTSLILLTTWGGTQYAWGDPMIIALAVLTVVGAVAFVLVEVRAKNPLIPMTLFRNRNMVLTTAAGTVLGLAMIGTLGYLPTYLQMVHTMTPTEAGLMMIPMMVGMIGTSTVVGFLISHSGRYKSYPLVGMAVVALALYLLSQFRVETSLIQVGVVLFVFGFGLGLVMQVLVLIVQNSFPVAVAPSSFTTCRTISANTCPGPSPGWGRRVRPGGRASARRGPPTPSPRPWWWNCPDPSRMRSCSATTTG